MLSPIAVLLAILPLSIALTCTESNALSWPSSGNSSGGSSDDCNIICGTDSACLQACNDDPCATTCGNDAACLQTCYAIAEQGQCAAVGCPGDTKKLKIRDTLSCTSSETCYMYTDGSLLCLDTNTGDYTDQYGGSGNVDTGVYTEPNGQTTTVLSGATGTVLTGTLTASPTRSTIATSAGSSSASRTRTTTSASSTAFSPSVTSASTTSATSNSGVEKLYAAPAFGAFGLVMGLVL